MNTNYDRVERDGSDSPLPAQPAKENGRDKTGRLVKTTSSQKVERPILKLKNISDQSLSIDSTSSSSSKTSSREDIPTPTDQTRKITQTESSSTNSPDQRRKVGEGSLYQGFKTRHAAVTSLLRSKNGDDESPRSKKITDSLSKKITTLVEKEFKDDINIDDIKEKIRKEVSTFYPEKSEKEWIQLSSLYLKKTGVILEPILDRLERIRNFITGFANKQPKYLNKSTHAIYDDIQKLISLVEMNDQDSARLGITSGKDLATFLKFYEGLSESSRSIIKYGFGSTHDYREKVLAKLKNEL